MTGERGLTGDRGKQGEKGERGRSFLNFSKLQLLAFLIVVVAFAYTVNEQHNTTTTLQDTISRIERETNERRDVSCLGQEGQHEQEIRDLERSFKIYLDPPPELASLVRNPLVLQGLREDIRNAQNDGDRFGVFVSPFCDDKGYGKSEPDPEVPEIPQSIKAILNEIPGT